MPDKTEEIIIDMLTQSTGRALCDSGGTPQYDDDGNYVGSKYGYGRHYERNRGRNFKEEPPATATVYEDECIVHVSLFHFLSDMLEYEEEMDEKFYEFVEENEGRTYMQDMIQFVEEGLDGELSTPYYMGPPSPIYTYNMENLLDQEIQFLEFMHDDYPFLLVQSHNGCDARGGMSAPHVFSSLDDLSGFATRVNTCVILSCDNCYTGMDNQYDGWTFELQPVGGRDRTSIENFEVVTIDPSVEKRIEEAAKISEEISNSPCKQLSLDGSTKEVDRDEIFLEKLSEIFDKDLREEELFSWRIEDYDDRGDYLSCPVCKLGRMGPIKVSY